MVAGEGFEVETTGLLGERLGGAAEAEDKGKVVERRIFLCILGEFGGQQRASRIDQG